MDSFASLALTTEKPDARLLKNKPYSKFELPITLVMTYHIACQLAYQLAWMLGVYFAGVAIGLSANFKQNNTLVFNIFVFCQLFNQVNSRRVNNEWNLLEHIYLNWIFFVSFAVSVGLQAVIVQFGGQVMHTVPLTWYQWLMSIGVGFLCVPFSVATRILLSALQHCSKRK